MKDVDLFSLTEEELQKIKWWELLTDEEIEVLSKEFPDYKKYDRPTLDMKTLLDFFFMKKYGG